ncbi:MAG: XylR family transcriptional regulator [Kiritimatiellae bacterium]|nr:XylR family transcriptional regulator [Kiritimatiellia bacterium]
MLRGILQYVHFHGPWNVHLIEGREGEQKMLHPDTWGCTGIIGNLDGLAPARRLMTLNVPIICTNRTDEFINAANPLSRLNCVVCDNHLIGQRAAEYFIGLNFKHFAFVGQVNRAKWSEERKTSFCARLLQDGCCSEVYTLSSAAARKDFGIEQRDLCDWLKRLPKPVAIFAANDVRGRQVLDSCAKARIAVPQEVAVLSVDNDELLCETTIPQMSSIQMTTEQAGFEAARVLDGMMRGRKHGNFKQTVITYGFSHIVTRPSTATVLLSDALVVRTLEFIRINSDIAVKVEDLAQHLHVSRRSLETRFKSVTGRTVYSEIMRVRLDRVQTLLCETPLSIERIAETCGFNDASHLGKAFRQHFNMTLSAYRRKYLTSSN